MTLSYAFGLCLGLPPALPLKPPGLPLGLPPGRPLGRPPGDLPDPLPARPRPPPEPFLGRSDRSPPEPDPPEPDPPEPDPPDLPLCRDLCRPTAPDPPSPAWPPGREVRRFLGACSTAGNHGSPVGSWAPVMRANSGFATSMCVKVASTNAFLIKPFISRC